MINAKEFDQLIAPVKEKALALVDKNTFAKECGFALQIVNANPKLAEDKTALLQAIYNIVLTGLSLNPVLKYAYLIPRWSKDGAKAVLEPSYQGLVKLITDAGSVKSISCYPVFDGDEFDVTFGTHQNIHHRPKYKSQDITHVYAVAVLTDGKMQIEVMDAGEINHIREMSESYKAYLAGKIKSCIWVDHYAEMARKTILKRISKYLPKTERWEKVSTAIELDNQDFIISEDNKWRLLDVLDNTTAIESELCQKLRNEVLTTEMSTARAAEIWNQINNSGLDPIMGGSSYSQTDIKKHLNKLK